MDDDFQARFAISRLSGGARSPAIGHLRLSCQQSAEKVLKAYLTWHDRPLIRTHNLLELVATCAEIDDSFTNLRDAAVTLNPYAFRFRYPGSEIEPSSTQAEAAISFAEQVYAFVMDRLPEGSQPGEETQ